MGSIYSNARLSLVWLDGIDHKHLYSASAAMAQMSELVRKREKGNWTRFGRSRIHPLLIATSLILTKLGLALIHWDYFGNRGRTLYHASQGAAFRKAVISGHLEKLSTMNASPEYFFFF